ncbi:MAG: tRNA (adenosine(37)-N6)-threonylcarbamoyltransferase complex ATPase subunit type 1 TsaE [Chitinispirillaceae bacterium]|nr:tRNA (adenosine(37)-N6)-threonylcarbamoyltransferase complex ATPase subunit type 1 TsaE [Chitinispirillaceae bacterium]
MLLTTTSVEATRAFGAKVASSARPGELYALEGELGTGKTEFVRGFVNEIDAGIVVRSPSFTIVNTYDTVRFPVYHFDFYRLHDASELDEIGFDEYLTGEGVCLIEWGTLFPSVLPPHARLIIFRDTGPHEREIRCNFDLAGTGI